MELWLEQHKYTILTVMAIIATLFFIIGPLWSAIRGNPETVKALAKTTFGTYPKVTALAPLGCPTSDNTK